MKPDIKICGLKTAEAIDRAVTRGATHIGFIFFEKSPRYIEPDDAAKLADRVRGRAKIVAVVVNPTNDDLDEIVATLRPDILQLHGDESPERVLTIKAVYALPVMKAFSIRTADDLKRVEAYIGIADRFLFDAKPPKGSELPGGNGVSFDWTLLSWLDGTVDYMLSGGLNKDNIAEALAITKAPGLDASSGLESAPGVKSVALIDEFFDAVEQACRPEMASGS
ncbi:MULTISPECIES: phosphoribosylanthranilate isomerase [unclassified Rhizobium]|jgi:phosphoribosylanthranilate isomerase|uniref:phosphoribosylanthranilate isomerase n=1 Tax=unclassified Rhizobium TaxID=2613769 RepID=UPI000373BA3E|nr:MULTISPECIES: phosphoribosylanthranilate isomerase [unclassified Rhizobium]MBO9122063.1 phosphoribosylanthranilate isomerase [Rhizobium sp. 16-488-2b]MBO9172594.1 phosphoribosylanthranilate isomerase [Rhizobium sp. 16-488-2a]MBO9195862.1 phosphoribosylanthranilate isomerase [Rhizobium sp. 16-449-1b]